MDKTKNVNMKLPTDPKDVAALKTFLEQVRSQVCGMADVLKEPFKSHFNELKNQFDSALSKLPPSEQVPAAMDAHQHLIGLCSCLCSASSLVTALSQKLNGMEEGFASALSSAVDVRLAASLAGGEFVKKADIEGLVAKGVEAKVTAGEVVAKDMVTSLCSAAKAKGLEEGELKVREEVKVKEVKTQLVSTRKAALATAGVPLPSEKLESILAADEAEFNGAKAKVEVRRGVLNKKGIALNSNTKDLAANLWLPEDQWTLFEQMCSSFVGGPDPLLSKPAASEKGKGPGPMLC